MQDYCPNDQGCGEYGGESGYVDETTIRGQYGACSPCQSACGVNQPYFTSGGLWFQNYGDFVTQQPRGTMVHGYSADSYGLNFGYDILKGTDSIFGVAFGGAFSEAEAKKSDQRNNTDSFLLALYGGMNGCAWNVLGSIGYVHSAFETYRSSVVETKQRLYSKHHGETMFGSFEISSNMFRQALGMTPFLSYDFIRMTENGFAEQSKDTLTDALTMSKRRSTSYLQTLGLRFDHAYYEEGGWLVQPSFSFGWLHDYGQRRISTKGMLDGQSYSFKGNPMNKNRFVMSLGVTASLNNRTSLFARYDGEFNRRYNAQTVQCGFGFGY